MKTRIFFLTNLAALLLTACNMPSGDQEYDFNQLSTFAAQTVEASGTQAVQTPGTAATPETGASPTVIVQATANTTPSDPDCNKVSFVADVTVPDDTPFFVEKPFTKTWRLKNNGTCTWTSDYKLIFDSGYRMSGPLERQLTTGTVAPGETTEISVDLIAPALAGTYRGNWKIKTPQGETFALTSGPFWVQVKARRGNVIVWKTLKQGDASADVYAVQYLLKDHGYSLLVDGIFGPDTRTNVRSFQNKKDIDEDGSVGPETWENIVIQVSQGANRDAVRAVQYLLKNKYSYTLEVDGIFGPITFEAVKDFQSKQGLTPDGVVNPLTWQKLIGK